MSKLELTNYVEVPLMTHLLDEIPTWLLSTLHHKLQILSINKKFVCNLLEQFKL